ncbi:hypothetical protein MNV49_002277 [Pseudohyphozyma bogoriensis]|nr:hypothetical protein MNV49_002277 [Pseudohyphozyma bogoriensis]
MSAMNLDKPLDELIATKKKANRGRRAPRGGAAGAATGGRIPSGPQAGRKAPAATPAAAASSQIPVGDKIVVSNLPDDVTEAQVKELFTSTIGPIRSASLAYDSKGKSKGVATIQFNKVVDAQKAYQQYNKRLVDGKRPMKVEIIVDPSKAPPVPLTSRLGAAPAAPASSTIAAAGGAARQPRAAGTGGGRRRGGGRGPRSEPRPKATVESLDAEMSEYIAGGKAADKAE